MKNIITLFCLSCALGLISFTFISKEKHFKSNYAFVPSGTFNYNDAKVSVGAFYMSSGEVTNGNYREFLNDLKANGNEKDYKIALPDTAAWNKTIPNTYLEPMANMYFWHPAYANYPVVNISKQGAELYCEWLTKKMKQAYPKKTLNRFRLPTKAEWIYAAKGGNDNAIYPWGTATVRNTNGNLLANFMHIGEQNIKKDSSGQLVVANKSEFLYDPIDDYTADLTAVTKSYNPNNFGLYNMAGNVAELVADENVTMGGSWYSPGFNIQTTSQEEFKKPNPMTGFRVVCSFMQP